MVRLVPIGPLGELDIANAVVISEGEQALPGHLSVHFFHPRGHLCFVSVLESLSDPVEILSLSRSGNLVGFKLNEFPNQRFQVRSLDFIRIGDFGYRLIITDSSILLASLTDLCVFLKNASSFSPYDALAVHPSILRKLEQEQDNKIAQTTRCPDHLKEDLFVLGDESIIANSSSRSSGDIPRSAPNVQSLRNSCPESKDTVVADVRSADGTKQLVMEKEFTLHVSSSEFGHKKDINSNDRAISSDAMDLQIDEPQSPILFEEDQDQDHNQGFESPESIPPPGNTPPLESLTHDAPLTMTSQSLIGKRKRMPKDDADLFSFEQEVIQPSRKQRKQQQNLDNSLNSPSFPEEPSIKPKILFSNIPKNDSEECESIVQRLGGEVVSAVAECTHLVMSSFLRSPKFLSALAQGKFIMSLNWIKSSESFGNFLNEQGYELESLEAEEKYSFKLQDSLSKARERELPLLNGMKFFISAKCKPNRDVLKEIIEGAGGLFLKSAPKKPSDDTIIVANPGDSSISSFFKKGFDIFEPEYVLSGILKQELDSRYAYASRSPLTT